MFKRTTAIIVGAGASVDLGFPSGDGLKQIIANLLELDAGQAFGFKRLAVQRVLQAEQHKSPVQFKVFVEEMRRAAASINRALPAAASIDNLIHTLQDEYVEKLAKLAIAISILDAESSSAFWKQSQLMHGLQTGGSHRTINIRTDKMLNTWYYPLARLLFTDVKKRNLKDVFNNVTFIVFNYDRCLEQFLYEVIQDSFDVDGATAAAVLELANFIHPYGSLGPLEWQINAQGEHLALGHVEGVNYWNIVRNLLTFTETVESNTGRQIKTAMGEAYAHLYVGFGFLGQNVELLRPQGNRRAGLAIATAFGFSETDTSEVGRIMSSLGREMGVATGVERVKCREMFDNRRLELSAI